MFMEVQGPWNPWFGRLGLLLEMHYTNPFIFFALLLVVVSALAIAVYLVYSRRVIWFWREWLTTVDHKKIGIMYIALGLVMLARGFFEAIMLRAQQAIAAGESSPDFLGATHGFLTPFHMNQIFTAHGTIMIIVAVTPILVGFMNIIVPLQIGARDMAYPFLNAVGLAFTAAAAALIMGSLFIGFFSHAAWVGLMPLAQLPSSPGPGVDYWIWSIQIASIGTTLGAVNLIATILKMRAPGMKLMRMPMFTWTSLGTNIIALTSFPVLSVALALLTLDRYIGTHFFTVDAGGNLMMYTNLFWLWGHPEVYFVVLPAFGFISEIVPTFSRKTLFNYTSMVLATMAIGMVSWLVWLHHFFVMGAGPLVNSFFSMATMLVGIPTGVKVFNWAFTMWRGRVRLETPMLWAAGAILLLIGGGMTGMMLAIPAINYVAHNTVFVVAHFHNMFLIIVFATFGAFVYWWPKMFGFKLDEYLGRWFFWLFWAGSVFVFVPMYVLGFLGMTRRLAYIPFESWQPLLMIQLFGIVLYTASVMVFLLMLYVSIRDRHAKRVTGPDAWQTSRNLEWATHTPPPFYNFAVQPVVHAHDEWAWRRERGLTNLATGHFEPIHMPKNSAIPVVFAVLVTLFGFAMVWRIPWLAVVSLVAIVITVIVRGCMRDIDYTVPAEEVGRIENEKLRAERDGAARTSAPEPGDNAGGVVDTS